MAALRVMWFVPPPIAILAKSLEPDAVKGALNRSSDEQFDALVSGSADAVVTAMDNVFAWNRRAGPGDFQVVAQLERTTPLTLVGSKAGDLSDLRGAEILVDAPENGFVIALRAMLADAGIPPQAYSLREAGGVKARFDDLMAGIGDATLLGPPFDSMALTLGRTMIARVQDAYPKFPGQGLVVRHNTLIRRLPQFRAWFEALESARKQAEAVPDAASIVIAAAGFEPLAAAAMVNNLPHSLRPDREGVDLLVRHRQRLGLPGGDDTYETLVNETLLKEEKE